MRAKYERVASADDADGSGAEDIRYFPSEMSFYDRMFFNWISPLMHR